MTQSHSPSRRWTFWSMLAVLLLASYLRIHDLNAQGLWGDEGWSIWLARGDSLRDLTLTMVADHHGPIYSTLLRAWDGIAGQSVLALRWITVLFSVGSVALIYGLGRAMFTPAAGVGAALAFALMDKQIVLAQEVRDYPMVFFSMIAIAYFYVRWLGQNQGAASSAPTKALRRRGIRVKPASPPTPSPSEMERGSQPGHSPTKASETTPPFSAQRGNGAGGIGVNAPGYAFWFVACSVWGLYLHYYCFMVNLAILLHALITLRDRQAWRHFLALNGLIALAFAPWLPVVVHQFVNTPVDSEVLNIHGMPFNRHTLEYLATESFGKPVAIYAMLALVGWVGPISTRLPGVMMRQPVDRRRSMTLLAVLWFGFPVIITAALHSRYPLLTDRNISVIMPAIALLVGLGLTAFERHGALWIAALVIVNELLVTGAFYDKPPWREMAADVAARTPAGEPVLLDVEGEHAAAWVHFSLDLPVDMRRIVNLLPPEAEGVDRAVSLYDLRKRYRGDFVPRLQGILAPIDGVWLVYWGDEAKKRDIFDVLAAAGFVRTGTRYYEHHGYPIYAYRYDRGSALETPRARFGTGINLLRAEWPASVAPGDTLSGLLWWGSDIEVLTDYTVSVFLLDSGGTLRAQHDGYPADAQRPTSTWIPGSLIFDAHLIDLPENLPPGEYTLGVKLYTWWDGAILPTADGGDYQVLGSVTVR